MPVQRGRGDVGRDTLGAALGLRRAIELLTKAVPENDATRDVASCSTVPVRREGDAGEVLGVVEGDGLGGGGTTIRLRAKQGLRIPEKEGATVSDGGRAAVGAGGDMGGAAGELCERDG